MKATQKNMPQALRAALKLETKGSAFYLKMSARTGNLLAKRLFDQLALQEVEHIGRINEVYAALSRGQSWPKVTPGRALRLEAEMRRIFPRLAGGRVREKLDNVSGMKVALDMEWYSYKMYQKLSASAPEGPEKQFFGLIMKEESKHYEALSNVYAYLTDNGDWLERSESGTWNWMNS
jgi:rubrerythrin